MDLENLIAVLVTTTQCDEKLINEFITDPPAPFAWCNRWAWLAPATVSDAAAIKCFWIVVFSSITSRSWSNLSPEAALAHGPIVRIFFRLVTTLLVSTISRLDLHVFILFIDPTCGLPFPLERCLNQPSSTITRIYLVIYYYHYHYYYAFIKRHTSGLKTCSEALAIHLVQHKAYIKISNYTAAKNITK